MTVQRSTNRRWGAKEVCPVAGGGVLQSPRRLSLNGLGRRWIKDPTAGWTGGKFRNGPGQFGVGPKMRRAHRVAWERTYGSPPPAPLRSTCGKPQCVRPGHRVLADRMGRATNVARTALGSMKTA